MPLYTVAAKGSDGNEYAILLDCDSIESCENIIKQLNLHVAPCAYGQLIKTIPLTLDEMLSITQEQKH